jgi:hypothetical protein
MGVVYIVVLEPEYGGDVKRGCLRNQAVFEEMQELNVVNLNLDHSVALQIFRLPRSRLYIHDVHRQVSQYVIM